MVAQIKFTLFNVLLQSQSNQKILSQIAIFRHYAKTWNFRFGIRTSRLRCKITSKPKASGKAKVPLTSDSMAANFEWFFHFHDSLDPNTAERYIRERRLWRLRNKINERFYYYGDREHGNRVPLPNNVQVGTLTTFNHIEEETMGVYVRYPSNPWPPTNFEQIENMADL